MAVTAFWYGCGLQNVCKGSLVWLNSAGSTVKVALCTSTYSPNQDTHNDFADITNELSTANGYTAGGATLTKVDAAYDAGTNECRLDASDTVWSNTTITARYAIIYIDTGTAATSSLLGYVDFGADQTTVAGDFTITWAATGVLKITAA
jgi:hypothetical protein